jgi:hypothetical protein
VTRLRLQLWRAGLRRSQPSVHHQLDAVNAQLGAMHPRPLSAASSTRHLPRTRWGCLAVAALVVGLTLAATPLWALSLTLLLGSVCACAVAGASVVGDGEASRGDDR